MADEEENNEQLVPETGAVFTFGRSRFADNVPNRFWIRNDPIKQVACGDEHTLLLTKSGRVFSFGANDWGQLGHGNLKVYTKPTSIKAIRGIPAYLIACGRSHSLIALEERKVIAFGQNNDGELGVGDTEQHTSPVAIDDLNDYRIAEASGGAHHSAVLTDSGRLFLWGSNSEGQLGMLHVGEESLRPVQLEFEEEICHVSCGYYHTAIVTSEGNLFTFGESENGKLGHPVRRNETVKEPRIVDIPEKVAGVACGGKHTIAISQSGQLHVFGDGAEGQLGVGMQITELEGPRLLESLASQNFVHVACGESHSAAITEQRQVYVWGSDQYGKLGLVEDLNDQHNKHFEPRLLQKFSKLEVLQVSCGGCHTIILARPSPDHVQNIGDVPPLLHKRSITDSKEDVSESTKKHWKEDDKENEQQAENGEVKLPKLAESQKSDALQGAMNARARRRQSSVSNAMAARDHPTSLADRAVSISAEIHRSLNGTSYSKPAFADICQDADLLKKFEKPEHTAEDSDEEPAAPFRYDAEANGRKYSDTEMLHKEINRSLTVFCRGTADDHDGPSRSKAPQEEHVSADSGSDTKVPSSDHRGSVYGRQTDPIPSVPPTRVTAAAKKYTRENGFNEPLTMSENMRYVAGDHNHKAGGDSEENSYDLKEIGQSQDRSEDDDPGLSMLMDKRHLSSHDSELAEETADHGQTILETSQTSRPDARPAFAESAGHGDAAKKGPLKRISGLLSRVKDAKAKANGETGKEPGTGSNGVTVKKSRACTIL